MDLIVETENLARWGDHAFHCAIGRQGLIAADSKREGDGATPIGRWVIRNGFYRPDRMQRPETALNLNAMRQEDAWCDVVGDANYNKHVSLPYATLDERLWRDDHLYDIVFMLGYNDDPIVQGKGSAIFLHLARPDYSPSSGCITLALPDLLTVLREATPNSAVTICPG